MDASITTRFLAALSLVFVTANVVAAEPAKTAEPIKIGVTTSRTGSLADFGIETQRGIEMWVADINERGALLGRPVKLVSYDDASNASQVTTLYQKLIAQDKVDFLISPYSSNLTAAAIAVAEPAGIPMVSIASASDLWKHGYKNLFGLYTPGDANMDPVLELAKQQGLKTIALVYLDDDFPRHVADGVRSKAAGYGLSVVVDQRYTSDFKVMPALAKQVAAANPDVVIVGCYMDDAVVFAKAAKSAGVKPKLMAFSGAPALKEFGDKLGVANVQGMIGTVQWSRDVRVPGGFDFGFRFAHLYDEYPSYDAAGGYGAGQVIEAAVRLAGTTDRTAVRNELAVLKFRSILGNYRVDATGLQTAKSTFLVQWQQDHISLVYPPDVARWKLMYPYPG